MSLWSYEKIKDSNRNLEKAKKRKNEEKFRSNLNETKGRNEGHKLEEQKNTNIYLKMFYKPRGLTFDKKYNIIWWLYYNCM